MYHSRSFPYLSIVIVVATVRLAFRVFLVTMELAWYDRFVVRFLHVSMPSWALNDCMVSCYFISSQYRSSGLDR